MSSKKQLTKLELAKELLIILETKIQHAIEKDCLDSIHIFQVLKKVLDQTIGVYRSDVVVPLHSNYNLEHS